MPLHTALAELLERSDERDAWLARVIEAEESGYARGLADGVTLGRQLEAAERDEQWNRAAAPIARGGPAVADRWKLRGEPRTRQTFGRPHPADYPGGPVPWDHAEAGAA